MTPGGPRRRREMLGVHWAAVNAVWLRQGLALEHLPDFLKDWSRGVLDPALGGHGAAGNLSRSATPQWYEAFVRCGMELNDL